MPRYQLLLRCENVPKRRFQSYGTYMAVHDQTTQTTVGQTETVFNTPHPEFSKVLFVETNPSVYHPLQLIVYQDNGVGRDATALWHAQIEATEVVQSKGHEQVLEMSRAGKIIVRMVESSLTNNTEILQLQFRALDLQNVEPGWFGLGRSDPYFELSKKSVDPTLGWVRWHLVYRSEIIRDHLNPYWKPFQLTLEEACFGDTTTTSTSTTMMMTNTTPWRIRVYDDNGRKAATLIGQLETTFAQLSTQISQRGNADRTRALALFRDEHKETEKKSRGWLVVLQASVL